MRDPTARNPYAAGRLIRMVRPELPARVLNMRAVIGKPASPRKHQTCAGAVQGAGPGATPCHLAPGGAASHIPVMLPPRFPLTAAQIDQVVATFYGAVRRHEELGPVFAAHVTDWPAHEARIAAFWRNAILAEGSYEGSPMRAHIRAGNVHAAHFPVWLMLFDETLRRCLPQDSAKGWSALAHRIGGGLRMGIENMRPQPGPPVLR